MSIAVGHLSALRVALISAAVTFGVNTPAVAQFNAADFLDKQIARSLREMPYVLNPNSATCFPDVGKRAPQFVDSNVQVIGGEGALKNRLVPGDYAIPVIAYSMMFGRPQPGEGAPYQLARLEGKLSAAINALLVRGTQSGDEPALLNAIVWKIEVGITLDQMPVDQRAEIHQRIPEFEDSLKRDFLASLRSWYRSTGKYLFGAVPIVGGGKSYEEALAMDGDRGNFILELMRAKSILMQKGVSNLDLPRRLLVEIAEAGTPETLDPPNPPVDSPWAEVKTGVFVRVNIKDGVWRQNFLEVHVSSTADPALTLAKVIGGYSVDPTTNGSAPQVTDHRSVFLGYPWNGLAVPLLFVPKFDFPS